MKQIPSTNEVLKGDIAGHLGGREMRHRDGKEVRSSVFIRMAHRKWEREQLCHWESNWKSYTLTCPLPRSVDTERRPRRSTRPTRGETPSLEDLASLKPREKKMSGKEPKVQGKGNIIQKPLREAYCWTHAELWGSGGGWEGEKESRLIFKIFFSGRNMIKLSNVH